MSDVHNASGRCVVVAPAFEPHPNANALMLARIGGYTCVVRKDEWNEGDLAVYVPPDSVVLLGKTEFAWLASTPSRTPERIRVRKFRGVMSEGLLIHAPEGAVLGQDFTEQLGVTRYEAPITNNGIYFASDAAEEPAISAPRFDVEALKKFPNVLVPGETVCVTEKIHGANGRYVYHDGKIHIGSRNRWVQPGDNIWARALDRSPWLREFLEKNPGHIVFGEVFGWVQDLRYGRKPGEVDFLVFDVFDTGTRKWWSPTTLDAEGCEWGLLTVPLVWHGPYNEATITALADGNSIVTGADCIREGIVVRPLVERTDPALETLGGRVILKVVSNAYLSRE